MVDLTRRFFLGGAIALVATKTFVPSVNAMGNMPTIYGNGYDDDSYGLGCIYSYGLGCIFRNEPVIFKTDKIAVEEHKGVIFFGGRYAIERSVNLPASAKIEMHRAEFIGYKLEPHDMPFFMAEIGFNANQFDNGQATFDLPLGYRNRLVQYPNQTKTIPADKLVTMIAHSNGERIV
jgi:hypothetical protein